MAKFYSIDKKYIEYIESKGVNIELLLRKVGMTKKAINKNRISINRDQYILLMNSLEEMITSHSLLCYSNIESMISSIPHLFAGIVRSILFELIPSGDASIENVAKELNLSIRTLQRKLSEEKTTFVKQLNHTRELLARSYLKDEYISNDDIAFLIGYSDTNSFVRAFKVWTGMIIIEYRNKYSNKIN